MTNHVGLFNFDFKSQLHYYMASTNMLFSDPPIDHYEDRTFSLPLQLHPAVFLFSGKHYRCKICPASRWQSAAKFIVVMFSKNLYDMLI